MEGAVPGLVTESAATAWPSRAAAATSPECSTRPAANPPTKASPAPVVSIGESVAPSGAPVPDWPAVGAAPVGAAPAGEVRGTDFAALARVLAPEMFPASAARGAVRDEVVRDERAFPAGAPEVIAAPWGEGHARAEPGQAPAAERVRGGGREVMAPMAAPAAPQGGERESGGRMEGAVVLDGHLVGRWMAEFMASEAGRPQAGPNFFDARMGPVGNPGWSAL